jgi:hypothetical protein
MTTSEHPDSQQEEKHENWPTENKTGKRESQRVKGGRLIK